MKKYFFNSLLINLLLTVKSRIPFLKVRSRDWSLPRWSNASVTQSRAQKYWRQPNSQNRCTLGHRDIGYEGCSRSAALFLAWASGIPKSIRTAKNEED